MSFAEHEFPPADSNGYSWCKWCGAPQHPQMALSCLQRETPASEMAPEPKRRTFAVDDADTISARLVELAKERLPVDHNDPGDCF